MLFYAPRWAVIGVIDVVLLLAFWELIRIGSNFGAYGYPLTFVLIALAPWVWVYGPSFRLEGFIILCMPIFAHAVLSSRHVKESLPSVSFNLLGLVYLGLPLAMLAGLHSLAPDSGGGVNGILFVLAVVWVADTGAYFFGKAFGRHRITPVISPNKSAEGFIAGIVFGVAAAVVFGFLLFSNRTHAWTALAGGLLSIASIFGDLFESMLKRGAGVKDSSQLLPGHGGMLDRIDSVLFAFPIYYLLITLFN
jgi:phosphatidate cytidylyltransferase